MNNTLSADEIRDLLRKESEKVGGVVDWCKKHNVSTSFAYEVLKGMREPSAKLTMELGYRRVLRYEPLKAEQTKQTTKESS